MKNKTVVNPYREEREPNFEFGEGPGPLFWGYTMFVLSIGIAVGWAGFYVCRVVRW